MDAPRDALAFEHVFILRLDMARAGVGSFDAFSTRHLRQESNVAFPHRS